MAERQHATGPRYKVTQGDLSTRRENDPSCEDWIEFKSGHTYGATQFPAHMDVAALVAAGLLEEVIH